MSTEGERTLNCVPLYRQKKAIRNRDWSDLQEVRSISPQQCGLTTKIAFLLMGQSSNVALILQLDPSRAQKAKTCSIDCVVRQIRRQKR